MKKTLSLFAFCSTVSLDSVGARSSTKQRSHRAEVEGFSSRSIVNSRAPCLGGGLSLSGELFRCSEIDFLSLISLEDVEISGENVGVLETGADVWGWTHVVNDTSVRELTLWTTNNALWFIDSTDPENPKRLAVATFRDGESTRESDVKVVNDFAWFGKDDLNTGDEGTGGILGFDLNKIMEFTEDNPANFISPGAIVEFTVDSHNLISNSESNRLYACGGNVCNGGLIAIDVADPLAPSVLACVGDDGQTNDAQCVVYDGPDQEFQGEEICFAFKSDSLTVYLMTDPTQPEVLSRAMHVNATKISQGWLNKDLEYALVSDEYDETSGNFFDESFTTKTYVVDVSNLRSAVFVDIFSHETVATDHNLYFWGAIHEKGWGGSPAMASPPNRNFAYMSNYNAGLRVIDAGEVSNLKEVGYFDLAPDKEDQSLTGSWSNYLHPSGVLAVSSIDRGLFFLEPKMAFDQETVVVNDIEPTAFPTDPPFVPPTVPGGWVCNDDFYSNVDGCDCGCGLRDPDCDTGDQEIFGCDKEAGELYCIDAVCSQFQNGEPPVERDDTVLLYVLLVLSVLGIAVSTVLVTRTNSTKKESENDISGEAEEGEDEEAGNEAAENDEEENAPEKEDGKDESSNAANKEATAAEKNI